MCSFIHLTLLILGTGGGGAVHGHKVKIDWLGLGRLCRYNLDGVMLNAFPLGSSAGFAFSMTGNDLLCDWMLTLDFPAMRLSLITKE